ncbi:MAG: CHAD domain-containing protein [Myxococcales bacterium]|nr:CHAD domain-containing protein [Myxococcota bacterium]MDW8281717.1 CHAD domain-containing protein [Myxococcales bacterium]
MPRPTRVPGLGPDTPRREGLRRLVEARLQDVLHHAGPLAQGGEAGPEEVERVHDARVATRRLGAVLGLYPLQPAERWAEARQEIASLRRALGQVRDLDLLQLFVQRERSGAQGAAEVALQGLAARLEAHRHQARGALQQQVVRFVQGPGVRIVQRALGELSCGQGRLGGRAMRRRLLRRLRRAQRWLGPALGGGADFVHELRIAIKKLRYHAEPLVGIVAEAEGLLAALPELQQGLGELHDHDAHLRWIVEELAQGPPQEQAGHLLLLRRSVAERKRLWPQVHKALLAWQAGGFGLA